MQSSHTPNRKNQKKKQRDAGDRWLCQLFGCGLLLMLVLALRMFVPGFETWLRATMEKQSGVQAVFSTLGDGLSGKSSWKETWRQEARMVFGSGDGEEAEMVFGAGQNSLGDSLEKSEKEENRPALSQPLIPAMEYTSATGQITPLSGKVDDRQDAAEAFAQQQTKFSSQIPDSVRYDAPILPLAYTAPSSGVVTSDFGYRNQPETGELQFHHGTDYGGETGDAILAFADGVVSAVGEDDIFGKYVVLQHGGGVITEYGHLSEICVSSGDTVRIGQCIGKMGESGNATGPCLHFVLLKDGWYLNPGFYVS